MAKRSREGAREKAQMEDFGPGIARVNFWESTSQIHFSATPRQGYPGPLLLPLVLHVPSVLRAQCPRCTKSYQASPIAALPDRVVSARKHPRTNADAIFERLYHRTHSVAPRIHCVAPNYIRKCRTHQKDTSTYRPTQTAVSPQVPTSSLH